MMSSRRCVAFLTDHFWWALDVKTKSFAWILYPVLVNHMPVETEEKRQKTFRSIQVT